MEVKHYAPAQLNTYMRKCVCACVFVCVYFATVYTSIAHIAASLGNRNPSQNPKRKCWGNTVWSCVFVCCFPGVFFCTMIIFSLTFFPPFATSQPSPKPPTTLFSLTEKPEYRFDRFWGTNGGKCFSLLSFVPGAAKRGQKYRIRTTVRSLLVFFFFRFFEIKSYPSREVSIKVNIYCCPFWLLNGSHQ